MFRLIRLFGYETHDKMRDVERKHNLLSSHTILLMFRTSTFSILKCRAQIYGGFRLIQYEDLHSGGSE